MERKLLESLSRVTQEEQRILDGGSLHQEEYTGSRRFVIDSDHLLQSGKLISLRPHTRFVDFPPHSHNYVELMYMAAGSTTHIINDSHPLTLRAGELLFMNQHVTHAIRRAEQSDVAINFIVLPDFFDTAFEMIGPDNLLGRFLAGSLQKEAGDVSYLHFAVADVLPVQNLVENLVWGILTEQPNNRRISQVTMGLLFLNLLNYTQRLELSPSRHGNNTLVVEALREIEENYRHANFSELAGRYNVSLAYVSRLVKQATGSTFKELLQQKRLAKAAGLLRQTGLPVADVITAVGYENTSYFHRIFKAQFGLSPSAFRQKED